MVETPQARTQEPPLAEGGRVGKTKAREGPAMLGGGDSAVGDGVIVGDAVVGVTVGIRVGLDAGSRDPPCVGAKVGGAEGAGVPPATQESLPAATQRGAIESNCSKVSNTDAKSHNPPVLFPSKLSILVNEFP